MNAEHYRRYPAPIGDLHAVLGPRGLIHFGLTPLEGAFSKGASRPLQDLGEWLESYFSGRDPGPAPVEPDMRGLSQFRRDIYHKLMEVGFGSIVSYSELGEQADHPDSARAVGGAMGSNPYLLIVPCHRVVAKDRGGRSSLGGFSCGLDVKRYLLELEGRYPF
ncbi:MAG: methylated-DNA--[protein]-cysteine S-methyltransferase [Candidatus Thermoplasmatota archaeon]|nr:methylated-DNA--[protein]-cysteine S-methyltransferase [Candidatus Thermoplasmatota archaeon]